MVVLAFLVSPIEQDKESGEHSAQMRKVGNVICSAASDAQAKFQNDITYNQPLGLDGEWEGNYKQLVVGEGHTVTQQNSVYGARCSYGKNAVQELHHGHCHSVAYCYDLIMGINQAVMNKLAEFLCESCAYAAEQIEQQELFSSPLEFHDASEHPDGEHVEEYVLESFMKEHVCNQLPYPETGGQEEMQSKQFVKVYSVF